MQFNPDTMSVAEVYRLMVQLITPRPIAWISTVSQEGVANLAPYSFYNGVGANPPSLLFCPANQRDGSRKDSLVNVLQTKEFVVNVVSESDAALMNQTSAQYAPGVSESEVLGIETQRRPSTRRGLFPHWLSLNVACCNTLNWRPVRAAATW